MTDSRYFVIVIEKKNLLKPIYSHFSNIQLTFSDEHNTLKNIIVYGFVTVFTMEKRPVWLWKLRSWSKRTDKNNNFSIT